MVTTVPNHVLWVSMVTTAHRNACVKMMVFVTILMGDVHAVLAGLEKTARKSAHLDGLECSVKANVHVTAVLRRCQDLAIM